MIINDRFTRGWIAGAAGGILGSIWGFLSFYMGTSTLRLSDWIAILVFGRQPPFSLGDHLHAVVVLAILSGVIGIVFAFLLPVVTEENIYFKGWVIFLIPWWIIYLLTALAQTAGTMNLPLMTVLSNAVGASITGLGTAYCYRLLDPQVSKPKLRSSGLAQPAAKRGETKDYGDKESDED